MSKKKITLANGKDLNAAVAEAYTKVLETLLYFKFESEIEEVTKEMDKEDRVVAMIYPEESIEVTSFAHRLDSYPDFDFDESEVDDEFGLCISYDSECIVLLGESRYLVEAPLLIFNIDDDGNECSIEADTINHIMKFLYERETCIEVDGRAFPAIRLD